MIKAVVQVLGEGKIKMYLSQRVAVERTGFSQSQMSKALDGKGETCGGCRWYYAEGGLRGKEYNTVIIGDNIEE